MSLEKVKQIVSNIKKGNIHPVYFLMGEEPFYIDAISDFIEDTILSEEEKGFNQMVLYGLDVTIEDIMSHAKRYPMMAKYQVIIVKEAQELSRTIDDLISYVENPQPTTVLVFCYKYKTIDRRKKLIKSIAKHGILLKVRNCMRIRYPNGSVQS